MSERLDRFDPYHQWLGIPPANQPPNHYRLLGVAVFEDDADVVASAADRQMAHVRTFQAGPHSADSQKLLNELKAARVCLLKPAEKAAYDSQLRRQLAPPRAASSQPAPPQPLPVQMVPTPPRPSAAAPSVRWSHPLIAPMAAAAAQSVAVRDRLASVVEPEFVVDRKRTSGGSRTRRPRVSGWSIAMDPPAAAPPPRDDLQVAGADDASRGAELAMTDEEREMLTIVWRHLERQLRWTRVSIVIGLALGIGAFVAGAPHPIERWPLLLGALVEIVFVPWWAARASVSPRRILELIRLDADAGTVGQAVGRVRRVLGVWRVVADERTGTPRLGLARQLRLAAMETGSAIVFRFARRSGVVLSVEAARRH